MIRHDFIRS